MAKNPSSNIQNSNEMQPYTMTTPPWLHRAGGGDYVAYSTFQGMTTTFYLQGNQLDVYIRPKLGSDYVTLVDNVLDPSPPLNVPCRYSVMVCDMCPRWLSYLVDSGMYLRSLWVVNTQVNHADVSSLNA